MDPKKDTRKEEIIEFIDRLTMNGSEYHLQEQILRSIFYEEYRDTTREVINRAVFEFAQKTNRSIYDVCLNYIPKVTMERRPGLRDPLGGRNYSIGVTVEMIRIPDDGFIKTMFNDGTKENSEGRTAGGRHEEGQESD